MKRELNDTDKIMLKCYYYSVFLGLSCLSKMVSPSGMFQTQSGVRYSGAEDNFDSNVKSQGIGTIISF